MPKPFEDHGRIDLEPVVRRASKVPPMNAAEFNARLDAKSVAMAHETITSANILDKLKMHPREETPAVCLIAGQEIERLRELLDSFQFRIRGVFSETLHVAVADEWQQVPRNG